MDRKKYSSFRLMVTSAIHQSSTGFCVIGSWQLFESYDGSGASVLTGGTPSASSAFGAGFEADKAFDSDPVTRWSSVSGSFPHWLRYDLPAAKKVGSIYLRLINNPTNGPFNFELQGSNDGGLTWEVIKSFTNFATQTEMADGKLGEVPQYFLAGTAVTESGAPADNVHLLKWLSGDKVASLVPGLDGAWSHKTAEPAGLLVVAIAGGGARPAADGPIYPERQT
jgi:hypothetical protein